MTQATNYMSFLNNFIEMNVNSGSAWDDISGFSNKLDVSGGNLAISSMNTWSTDTPIVTPGKKDRITLKVAILYTEGATDPITKLRTAYESTQVVRIRWSPSGSGSGHQNYTSGSHGYLINPPYPGGDASSAAPSILDMTIETDQVVKGTSS